MESTISNISPSLSLFRQSDSETLSLSREHICKSLFSAIYCNVALGPWLSLDVNNFMFWSCSPLAAFPLISAFNMLRFSWNLLVSFKSFPSPSTSVIGTLALDISESFFMRLSTIESTLSNISPFITSLRSSNSDIHGLSAWVIAFTVSFSSVESLNVALEPWLSLFALCNNNTASFTLTSFPFLSVSFEYVRITVPIWSMFALVNHGDTQLMNESAPSTYEWTRVVTLMLIFLLTSASFTRELTIISSTSSFFWPNISFDVLGSWFCFNTVSSSSCRPSVSPFNCAFSTFVLFPRVSMSIALSRSCDPVEATTFTVSEAKPNILMVCTCAFISVLISDSNLWSNSSDMFLILWEIPESHAASDFIFSSSFSSEIFFSTLITLETLLFSASFFESFWPS